MFSKNLSKQNFLVQKMMSFHTIHIIPHTTDIQMALQHFPLDIGTINCTFVSLVAHVETDILNRR